MASSNTFYNNYHQFNGYNFNVKQEKAYHDYYLNEAASNAKLNSFTNSNLPIYAFNAQPNFHSHSNLTNHTSNSTNTLSTNFNNNNNSQRTTDCSINNYNNFTNYPSTEAKLPITTKCSLSTRQLNSFNNYHQNTDILTNKLLQQLPHQQYEIFNNNNINNSINNSSAVSPNSSTISDKSQKENTNACYMAHKSTHQNNHNYHWHNINGNVYSSEDNEDNSIDDYNQEYKVSNKCSDDVVNFKIEPMYYSSIGEHEMHLLNRANSAGGADSLDSMDNETMDNEYMDSNEAHPHSMGKQHQQNGKKERRQTQSMNRAYNDLRNCIPNVPNDLKLSKIKILSIATKYIDYLSRVLNGPICVNLPHEYSMDSIDFKPDLGRSKRKCRSDEIMMEIERKQKKIKLGSR